MVSPGMLQVIPSTIGRRYGWRAFAAPRCRQLSATPSGAKARLTASQGLELLDRVNTFVFDCDGVIWRGEAVISGVPETLDLLRAHGKRLIFLTNNSTKSRKGYRTKFESLGIGSLCLFLTTRSTSSAVLTGCAFCAVHAVWRRRRFLRHHSPRQLTFVRSRFHPTEKYTWLVMPAFRTNWTWPASSISVDLQTDARQSTWVPVESCRSTGACGRSLLGSTQTLVSATRQEPLYAI